MHIHLFVVWKTDFYPLNLVSQAKWSPLHTLALSGQIHSMDKLLANGLDIDNVDKVCPCL